VRPRPGRRPGLGVGVAIAGEGNRFRARGGGAVQARAAASGADDARGAEQQGVLRGEKAGQPGHAEYQHRGELPGLGLPGLKRKR
jgi:hypothetical protein